MKVGVVATFFNWTRSERKLRNLQRFLSQPALSDVPLLIVECALFEEPFQLVASRSVIQVRCESVLWQKECLFNIALAQAPLDWEALAWIDADLLFANLNWSKEASELLRHFDVVQLFDDYLYLPAGSTAGNDNDIIKKSFMAGLLDHGDATTPALLGHPGFAWAARRSVLEGVGGLYERSIIGGADRLIAHAWFGDFYPKVVRVIARGAIFEDYLRWAEGAFRLVQGRVGLVRGLVLHQWHGAIQDRQYYNRHLTLDRFDFNPVADLTKNGYGCLEWASNKRDMHEFVRDYFPSRREDL